MLIYTWVMRMCSYPDFKREDYYGKRRNNSWFRTGSGCIGV